MLEESQRRAALVVEQDRILAKVSEFIREGMRAGRISDESGSCWLPRPSAHTPKRWSGWTS